MSRFVAGVYDTVMAVSERACLTAWRAQLLASAHGTVLEVGAGTGLNLAHYPAAVEQLIVTEPDPHMAARLHKRMPQHATFLAAGAESLPLPDASVDVVVSTLVLCTVGDAPAALLEMHRVLRPGGRLLFLEHVGAHDRPDRLKWQRRIEPVWKHLAGNCHLTRNTEAALVTAGFTLEAITRESMRKAPPWVRPTIRGVALRGGGPG